MLFSSAKRIRSGYIVAFLLLLFSYFLIFYSTSQMRKAASLVSHTHIIIAELESLRTGIAEAETGARGYIITKDTNFLTPYTNSLQTIPGHYKNLRELTSDNKDQQLKLDTISKLIEKRLSQFAFGLRSFRESGHEITPAMEAARYESRMTTDSIRSYLVKMKNAEKILLEKRTSKLSGLSGNTQTLIIISLIAAVLAIGYSLLLYNHERRAKNKFDTQAHQYRKELEETIRRLKLMNEELTELRSIEKFAATGHVARTIAHEVRNPLTNISLAAEQLQGNNSQTTESSQLLDMINRNATRINQLVSDLLNATRSMELDLQKTNINRLLDDALNMAKDRINLNHIKVEKNYTKELCMVTVDIEKIRFAFLNIIVNAIEAMEKNGVLQIRIKKEDQKCIVEISDNGKGMDEETIQRIFEPYYTEKPSGNGLGLTNTQNIIINHKGNIRVKSVPGKGTIFFISLDIVTP